ncbi:hypothetical protein AXK56_11640 [Tsukamurella pulmonis]|nr:hypothetical protein AXK56_11640 [Tsukamurella pulmonis]
MRTNEIIFFGYMAFVILLIWLLPAGPGSVGSSPARGPAGGRRVGPLRPRGADVDRARMIAAAQAAGWTLVKGRKHYKLMPPEGTDARWINLAATPSDRRAAANTASRLRRAGVPVPHRSGHR